MNQIIPKDVRFDSNLIGEIIKDGGHLPEHLTTPHGNNPNDVGYTIQELFIYVKSISSLPAITGFSVLPNSPISEHALKPKTPKVSGKTWMPNFCLSFVPRLMTHGHVFCSFPTRCMAHSPKKKDKDSINH
jgi:hypothetical protein